MRWHSDYIEIDFEDCDRIDLSVYQYRDDIKKVYLGRGSSVVIFPLDKLEEFIEFLRKAKDLKLEEEK